MCGGGRLGETARASCRHLGTGRAWPTHQSRFPRTLCPGPRTAGWLHGHSHRPGEGRPRQELGPPELRPPGPLHAVSWPSPSPPPAPMPTSWYFSRATLVSAPSCVSMKRSLFLWMFSRMPWGRTAGRSGCGLAERGLRAQASWLRSTLPRFLCGHPLRSQGPSGQQRLGGLRASLTPGGKLCDSRHGTHPRTPSFRQVGQAHGPRWPIGTLRPPSWCLVEGLM